MEERLATGPRAISWVPPCTVWATAEGESVCGSPCQTKTSASTKASGKRQPEDDPSQVHPEVAKPVESAARQPAGEGRERRQARVAGAKTCRKVTNAIWLK